MKIGIGYDHAGIKIKDEIIEFVKEMNHEVIDYSPELVDGKIDYPVPAKNVANAINNLEVDKGILICGSGIGISISANKVKGIRCAVCSDTYSAKMCVAHNNAQIIAFGARVVGIDLAKEIVREFLLAEFEGGRHTKRIEMIENV